jgi:hypothetical protein
MRFERKLGDTLLIVMGMAATGRVMACCVARLSTRRDSELSAAGL